MHPTLVAILIGVIGGVVAALCGVGGGVVMVPAFVLLLKMDQKGAVATSLAAIIFTALCTSFKNHANGLILWKVAIPSGIAGGIVGWLAGDLLKKLQDVTLTRIFATLIIVFGVQMWVQSVKKENLSKSDHTTIPVADKKTKNRLARIRMRVNVCPAFGSGCKDL
jgi:uncharacterized membrane protein YfcA